MRADTYFAKLAYIDRQIEDDKEELERLRQASVLPGINYEEHITGKGKPQSAVERIALKLLDLQQKIIDEIEELIDRKTEAAEVLRQIPDERHQIIIREFYIRQRSLDDIADMLRISNRQVIREKKKALDEAEKILNLSPNVTECP